MVRAFVPLIPIFLFMATLPAALLDAQSAAAISEFFEGRTVQLKLDMPGTHQGVDLYPQRSQSLDLKSYSNRLKQFGVSLRNGDSAMITKVKLKDDNVEFQLAGGGYGTSGDDTDISVHFTPSEKSSREKDIENQLKSEKDSDRKRSLQRSLDDFRSDRERHDRREREIAEQAAESKRQMVMSRRLQGGSRFNLKMDVKKATEPITPQTIMTALATYVIFPPESFRGSPSTADAGYPTRSAAAPPETMAGPPPDRTLKKGLTREQVDALYGQPSEVHQADQNGMKMTNCVYLTGDSAVKADFVNGVLVQYSISSR